MAYEDMGFCKLAASTGGMTPPYTTGAVEVETSASMLGAIIGLSAIAGVVIGATWVRRRTVNTYVGESRALAEGDDPRGRGRKAILDPEGRPKAGGEAGARRRVITEVEMPSRMEPTRRAREIDFFQIGSGLARGKGLEAPWIVERRDAEGNVVEIEVIGIDPNPTYERREMPMRRAPTGDDPRRQQTYEGTVSTSGRYKIRSFKVPVMGTRLGVPSEVIAATPASRETYRDNVPASAFGGKYPWEVPDMAPQTFRHFVVELRARQRREKGKK